MRHPALQQLFANLLQQTDDLLMQAEGKIRELQKELEAERAKNAALRAITGAMEEEKPS